MINYWLERKAIHVGDLVQDEFGKRMVAEFIEGDTVECYWLEDHELHRCSYFIDEIKKVF